jgi:long-chain acyl-CoA synthetase
VVETVPDLLTSAAQHYGRRTALITPDKLLSFTELKRLADNFGDGLSARGISPGDRIVLWLGNSWRWVVAYYGALSIGAEVVPANSLLSPDEVAYIVDHSDAKALIALHEDLLRLLPYPTLPLIVSVGSAHAGAAEFDELLEPPRVENPTGLRARRAPTDVAEICYTSGTTGTPKGAILSHLSLVTNAQAMALVHGKSALDVLGTALPCCHVYGTMVLNSAVAAGASLVLMPRFDEFALLTAIEQHEITVLEAVPAMYHALMNTRRLERFNVKSLRLCSVGGQAMAESRLEEVETRLHCPLHELWGMTELAGPGTTHPYNTRRIAGSIGIPLPFTEMRIADPVDTSRTMPIGQIGELVVRGPLVMNGYLNEPATTRNTITPDGWLRTGDLVLRDERGYLYLVDRLKDVILSGGYTLYPAEIERVISTFPAVALAAVVSVDDQMRGQIAKAVVTLRPDTRCEPEDLIAHCRQHLAKYKVPRQVEIVDFLPTGPTGKLLRRELRQRTSPRGNAAAAFPQDANLAMPGQVTGVLE